MKKITIIGAGHVGSHVASSLYIGNVCNEIALIDIDEKKALAHAIDLQDVAPYIENDGDVYIGDYSDLDNSDVIVISTCSGFCSEDRLEELERTKETIDEIIPHILKSKFDGIIVSISNPCDLIAQYMKEKTGKNVIGTGTMLDSARYRVRLAKMLNISPKSVNGYMLGEHGNSQFSAFSLTSINGISLNDYLKINNIEINHDELEENSAMAGWDIVIGKGCTEFGIGSATAYLIKAILNDECKVLSCSTYVEEKGVYTSVPCIIGKEGVKSRLQIKLSSSEQEKFDKSCDVLKENLKRFS